MRRTGWHILRSADAGPATYGNDSALNYCARMCEKAVERCDWDGRLFTLGISMGSLTALQMTWKGLFPYPVRAVATIDGVMDLQAVHASPVERRLRIEKAYAIGGGTGFAEATQGHDPLRDFQRFKHKEIPLLAFASSEDALLPIGKHSAAMVAASQEVGAKSKLVRTGGPHLAEEHFTVETASRIVSFFSELD